MRRSLAFTVALAALTAAGASAQNLGTPIYHSPYHSFSHTELAGYLSDPGAGVSVALQGEYRIARPKFDFGFTVGYIDASGNGSNLFGVGVDGRLPFSKHTQSFPLDASFTGGFGAVFGGGQAGFLVPVGVSLGRQILLEGSRMSFTPYVNPVVAPTFGDMLGDVQFGLGLGVDLAITKTFDLRVSGSLGDIEGVGIGAAWHH